jgi:hypothetical protein
VGHFPTWDCDVFCPGYIVYPIWIQLEAGKWARPLFWPRGCGLGITSDLSGWGPLDKVLKRMDFGLILDLSAIMDK